jgi:conjugative relaxase-like TrwC/TraI family protein
MMTMQNVSAAQAGSYYEQDDYYTEKGLMPSRWGGELAHELGLSGEFDPRKFSNALMGHFEGQEFKQRPNPKRAALDATLSAPKSVSIMALVKGDQRIIEAHDKAVQVAMARLEKLARTRITDNGVTQLVPVSGFAYASFRHDTSRLGDPNLHTHNTIFKAVMGPDGKLRSLDNKEMFRAQREMDATYKAVLASELRELGYRLVMTKDGFEIEGVSTQLIREMSQRTRQIDAALQDRGMSRETASAAARQVANKDTRDAKKDYNREALSNWWTDREGYLAKSLGLEPGKLTPAIPGHEYKTDQLTSKPTEKELYHEQQSERSHRKRRREPPPFRRDRMHHLSELDVAQDARRAEVLLPGHVPDSLDKPPQDTHRAVQRDGSGSVVTELDLPARALSQAIEHTMERQAVLSSRHALIAEAIQFSEYRATATQIDAAIQNAIRTGELIVGERDRMTTRSALENEKAIYQSYEDGRNVMRPIADKIFAYEKILEVEAKLKGIMSAGQRNMVEKIALGTNRVMVVEGDAGTGKSTGMEAVKKIAEGRGFKVFGMAPSAQAVESLQAAGIDTITSQSARRDDKFWQKVDEKSILVLDEGGLVDGLTMQTILEKVKERGARIAVVGDDKQFASVEAGRALYQLNQKAMEHGEGIRLDEMRRGRNAEMKGLHFSARDNPLESLDRMFANGQVTVYQNDQRRIRAIAKVYAAIPEEERPKTLVLTGTNADRISINKAIREALGHQGGSQVETFERYDITKTQARQMGSYETGDVVRFEANGGGFKKGEMLRVVEKTADKIILERGDGSRVDFQPHRQADAISIGSAEAIEIAANDRIRFTANDKDNGIANGDRGTVVAVAENSIKIRLDKNKEITLPIDGHTPLPLRYGYSQTGHSAQGATATNVLLHTKSTDATVDKKSWYTNITRAAESLHLFTDALEGKRLAALRQAIARSNDKELAHDTIQAQDTTKAERLTYIGESRGTGLVSLPPDANKEAITSALVEARERFGDDQKLHIEGGQQFKRLVVEVAVENAMSVQFTDKALNASLEKLRSQSERLHKQLEQETKRMVVHEVIGTKMSAADWKEAVALVGSEQIALPKQNGEYAGKVILVTDTHLVQLTGKNTAIAHDISKLANAKVIEQLADTGQLQGKHFMLKYDQVKGTAAALKITTPQSEKEANMTTQKPAPRMKR